jgi:hypothetical protein
MAPWIQRAPATPDMVDLAVKVGAGNRARLGGRRGRRAVTRTRPALIMPRWTTVPTAPFDATRPGAGLAGFRQLTASIQVIVSTKPTRPTRVISGNRRAMVSMGPDRMRGPSLPMGSSLLPTGCTSPDTKNQLAFCRLRALISLAFFGVALSAVRGRRLEHQIKVKNRKHAACQRVTDSRG